MTDIAIVIVNWNSGEYLRQCLDSIIEYRLDAKLKTVVVDNGSSDGSEVVASDYGGIDLIRLGSNMGFARACNSGARQAPEAEFYLFLNPDARLRDGVLSGVLAHMRDPQFNDCGICGVSLIDDSGGVARSCSRFPTPARLALNSLGVDRIWPKLGMEMREWGHSESSYVDQVIGAFFFVRADVFHKLGGFDERFFVYFEEVDFAWRARALGSRCYFIADVSAFHVGGGVSKNVKSQRLFYLLRSRLLYSGKHFDFFGRSLIFATTLVVEPIVRLLHGALIGRVPVIREVTGAYLLLLAWMLKQSGQ